MKQNFVFLKSSTARICVVILGSPGVGKTALLVRFLTKRFIGEYSSGKDVTYRSSTSSSSIDFLDTSSSSENYPVIPKGDYGLISYVVVYSVIDSGTFLRAKQILASLPETSPRMLLANKIDLEHRRQVSVNEGQSIAQWLNSGFFEVSAAENCIHLQTAFQLIIQQSAIQSPSTFQRRFSLPIVSKFLRYLLRRSQKLSISNSRIVSTIPVTDFNISTF